MAKKIKNTSKKGPLHEKLQGTFDEKEIKHSRPRQGIAMKSFSIMIRKDGSLFYNCKF